MKPIIYHDGDRELHGFAAFPRSDDGAPLPAVLLAHDGFGISDHLKERAQAIADLGYVAFVMDLYGKAATAADLDAALGLMAEFSDAPDRLHDRANAALAEIAAWDGVDNARIAAIGYCFGGQTVLEMARAGLPHLAGVVSFHGLLKTARPAQTGKVKAKVLVLNGAADALVPPEDVAAFEREMADAGARWELTNYGGAKHAFTNPAADGFGLDYLGYDETADRRSWESMRAFLAALFA